MKWEPEGRARPKALAVTPRRQRFQKVTFPPFRTRAIQQGLHDSIISSPFHGVSPARTSAGAGAVAARFSYTIDHDLLHGITGKQFSRCRDDGASELHSRSASDACTTSAVSHQAVDLCYTYDNKGCTLSAVLWPQHCDGHGQRAASCVNRSLVTETHDGRRQRGQRRKR